MGPIGHVVRAAIHAHRDFHSDQGPSQDVGRSMRKPNRSLLYTPVYDLVTAIEAKASKRSARGEAPPAASHAQAQGPSYASQPSSGTSTPTSAAAKSPRTAQPQPISYQVVSYRPQDQDPPMYCQGNDIPEDDPPPYPGLHSHTSRSPSPPAVPLPNGTAPSSGRDHSGWCRREE